MPANRVEVIQRLEKLSVSSIPLPGWKNTVRKREQETLPSFTANTEGLKFHNEHVNIQFVVLCAYKTFKI